MNAEEAQDAQVIFGDPPRSLADETDPALRDILKSADIVVHRSIRGRGQCIDGEIAPLGVARPVAPERHLRLAPERFDVLAQGRHLVGPPVDDQRHGAMLDAGRHELDVRCAWRGGSLRPERRWSRYRLQRPAPHQRVAHRAADDARFLAAAVEQSEHPCRRRRSRESRRRANDRPRHDRPARSFLDPGHQPAVLAYAPGRRSSPAARRRNAQGRRNCR